MSERLAEDLGRLAGRRRLPAQRGDGLLCGIFALSALPGADLHPGLCAAVLAAGRQRPRRCFSIRSNSRWSPWLADQLQALLAGVKENAGLGGPLGAVTLLAAAIVVFLQLDYMFGRIFGATKTSSTTSWWGYVRTVLYDRLSAFLMLMAVGALLLGLFVANVYVLAGVRMNIENRLPGGAMLSGWAQFLFTAVTNALLFGLIYKVLPKVAIRWRDALAGGLLVSLVWILGQRLLVTFLIGPSYTAYGIVGSFIAVMIWVYYVSVILFLGAEFVEALSIVGGRNRKPAKSDFGAMGAMDPTMASLSPTEEKIY